MLTDPLLTPSRLAIILSLGAALLAAPGTSAQEKYTYDALGRLTEVEYTATGKRVLYVFDALGNRQSVILGDPASVTFAVNDVSITEGGNLSFTITKTGTATKVHTVDYVTANGTAVSGDYTSTSGTASFLIADTTKTVLVPTTQDSIYELSEIVHLDLSNATNGAVITDAQGDGTINDNDTAPSISINDVTKEEGQSLTFTISKSGATEAIHAVSYATANFTATAGSDYVAKSGSVSFSPTQTSKTFTINGIEDTAAEPTESFRVNLSNPTNGAAISDSQGVGTITNDDNFPPNAVNDTYSGVNRNVWTTFYVLSNDSDPENDPLTITNASGIGTINIINGGTALQYKCSGCSVVDPHLTYWISDGNGGTDNGGVQVYFSGGGGGGLDP